MQIKDIMTPECNWVAPETSLAQASQQMRDKDIGFLAIGQNDKLIGTITDRDIAIRAVADQKNPESTSVQDVMSQNLYYCYDDQDANEICQNMAEMKVRRMPVVNRDKRLVGLVSLGDLSQAQADQSGQALQTITKENANQASKAA